jgi:predicted metalloprotease with PDZ domain
VKRIKPVAFVPYDLGREAYTRQLWAFEGFTSYYDDLALRRSGVIGIGSYLELLGRTITSVLRTPGRRRQSAAEASFDAWIKYYRPDENTPNAGVSYYVQGALIGLALDLTLRDSGSSLDELMGALWRTYGRPGIGVPEDGIERLASDLAGRSLAEFFARFVAGTEELPLAELLRGVGVALRLRAARDGSDRGGTPVADDEAGASAWLGAVVTGTEPRLKHVFSGGPAEDAGLAAGDVLVAVDGLRASASALERIARTRRPGEAIVVHAFRRDELVTTEVVLASAPHDTCWLEIDPAADETSRQRRLAWLGEDTPAAV